MEGQHGEVSTRSTIQIVVVVVVIVVVVVEKVVVEEKVSDC